jgi:hypothetical protein
MFEIFNNDTMGEKEIKGHKKSSGLSELHDYGIK